MPLVFGWIKAALALGHARLAVQDLSEAGRQPMKSFDSRYVVVFNGEIYNHLEIRQELSSAGLVKGPWKGQSDTESLLAAIQAWGLESSLRRFRGMSIALWDSSRHILHLATRSIWGKAFFTGVSLERFKSCFSVWFRIVCASLLAWFQ